MKTTLGIDDDLYRQAKAQAGLSGRKRKAWVSEGLHQVLGGAERGEPPRPKMKLPLVPSGKGEPIESDRIYELGTSSVLERR